MTVVAWDGKTLAADRRATSGSLPFSTTKLRLVQHTGEVMAITGDQSLGEVMMAWYAAGADPEKWPERQRDKDEWCRLIIASPGGAVATFEQHPAKIKVEDRFMAWGSGRDFAIMAMHLGKTAREAVELASLFTVDCGNGVDAVDLR